jgi:hypothetical protein
VVVSNVSEVQAASIFKVATWTSETMEHYIKWPHNPEHLDLNRHRRESLKTRVLINVLDITEIIH